MKRKFRIIQIITPIQKNPIYRIQVKFFFWWVDYVPYGKFSEDFSSFELAEKNLLETPKIKNYYSKQITIKEYNLTKIL